MIRLSVTDLDSYLYWLGSEDMELDELVARLRGTAEETAQMRCGKAFHKLMEHAREGEIFAETIDGFRFEFRIDEEISLQPLRELKGEVEIVTPSGIVVLVGKVDALGGAVHDYKLTERFEAERYADSYQWRSYLSMFGASTFIYDVFQARYDDPDRNGIQRVLINDYHRLTFHAYPEMRADLLRKVSGLAEIVAKYVPEKVQAEAA
jgi:hypothetical protein